MAGCKDCHSNAFGGRVNDVWKLYNPLVLGGSLAGGGPVGEGLCKSKLKGLSCSKALGGCRLACNLAPNCSDQFKSYYRPNCPIPLLQLRSYESQPWFRNRVVQSEWTNFVDELVTPFNLGCQACPGPDDWAFKCHKLRSLVGPFVPCVWDLPEQDPCDCTQYGINRDWRAFNEDSRLGAGDIACGLGGAPCCKANETCEDWPPYLGKKYGARYMGWAHPTKGMFPRTQVFNYQSFPRC